MCLKGVENPNVSVADCCRTVILSKLWKTKHKDPLHKGQAWYCEVTGDGTKHKYNARWGQLLEIEHGGKCYYMRAPCPDWDLEDVRAMEYEANNHEWQTAEACFCLIVCIMFALGVHLFWISGP